MEKLKFADFFSIHELFESAFLLCPAVLDLYQIGMGKQGRKGQDILSRLAGRRPYTEGRPSERPSRLSAAQACTGRGSSFRTWLGHLGNSSRPWPPIASIPSTPYTAP